MWAQNSLWAYVGILVSGLLKLRPENLYLNNIQIMLSLKSFIDATIKWVRLDLNYVFEYSSINTTRTRSTNTDCHQ